MARRTSKDSVSEVLPQEHCGDCASAYGYCCPGYDGSPIACRCPSHPERFLACSEVACGNFRERPGGRPSKVTERWSENRESHLVSRKVVPLFRDGERKPWKVVFSDEIPCGGISWDGTFPGVSGEKERGEWRREELEPPGESAAGGVVPAFSREEQSDDAKLRESSGEKGEDVSW